MEIRQLFRATYRLHLQVQTLVQEADKQTLTLLLEPYLGNFRRRKKETIGSYEMVVDLCRTIRYNGHFFAF
jgi:hypothetical protein